MPSHPPQIAWPILLYWKRKRVFIWGLQADFLSMNLDFAVVCNMQSTAYTCLLLAKSNMQAIFGSFILIKANYSTFNPN